MTKSAADPEIRLETSFDSSVMKTGSLLWYRGEQGLISEPGTVWLKKLSTLRLVEDS